LLILSMWYTLSQKIWKYSNAYISCRDYPIYKAFSGMNRQYARICPPNFKRFGSPESEI